jgi:hypothetical protein
VAGTGGSQPAQWASDPGGRHEFRYWDGTKWTDQVSDGGVEATDSMSTPPAGQTSHERTDAPPAAPAASVLTIGDITLTEDRILTANGSAPLKGSQWFVRDQSRTEQKIPTYAIVLAIVFALFCLLGLLFLLMKEKKTTGYVEVEVRSGDLRHATQIPVWSELAVNQVRAQVAQAQALAAGVWALETAAETATATLTGSGVRRVYLVLLWDSSPWTEEEIRQVVVAKQAELGCPTTVLSTLRVTGSMPTEPNSYVVSSALFACQQAGIAYESTRDEISYMGGLHPSGAGIGLITIAINAVPRSRETQDSTP